MLNFDIEKQTQCNHNQGSCHHIDVILKIPKHSCGKDYFMIVTGIFEV